VGFTRTDRGVFGLGTLSSGELMFYTSEDDPGDYRDDAPMSVVELQDSIRRVLGVTLPLGDASRLSRFTFEARQADRYRVGRILLAGDAAHLFPATGIALNAGMLDAVNLGWKLAADVHGWAPAGLLDTYHDERHLAGERTLLHTSAQVALRRGLDPAADALRELFSELLLDEQPLRRMGALLEGAVRYPMPGAAPHPLAGAFAPDLAGGLLHDARPVFLDLAGRADLRQVADHWRHRVEIHTAVADDRRADALLIRPDAHIAWAAAVHEPRGSAGAGLRTALRTWFGDPGEPALFGPAVGQDDVNEVAPDE
jgi:hypothetical protein